LRQRFGKIEIGSDVAQRLRTLVGVLRDREIAGDHRDGEAALAQQAGLGGELVAGV